MKRMQTTASSALALMALWAGNVYAAGGDVGQAAKQDTNWTAIIIPSTTSSPPSSMVPGRVR